MKNRANSNLKKLLEAPALIVHPGYAVSLRESWGLHGEDAELAFSISWRDEARCEWAADFTESALANARLHEGTVTMTDMEGEAVVLTVCRRVRAAGAGNICNPLPEV